MRAFQRQKAIFGSVLNPARLPVMVKKLQRRLFDRKGSITDQDYKAWLHKNAVPVDQWCATADEKLWQETKGFVETLFARYESMKSGLPPGLGGNACVRLLYFITRRYKPETVVETGVAMGFSSQAFLMAMKLNGGGRLYSSDFPYFRLPNAEKYIGIMVEDHLKDRWELHIDGDEKNLPLILEKVKKIDLFHYDSDKTYEGRQWAFGIVREKLTGDTVIIIDDIQDNPHFYDLVMTEKVSDWRVLENRGGFIGLINACKAGVAASD